VVVADIRNAARDFERALLSLDRIEAEKIIDEFRYRLEPVELVERTIVPALESLGERWDAGSIALSQVYMSGRICEDLVDSILPPGDPDRKGQPRIAIAGLSDQHALGKRIVYSTLRASGFELRDFGKGLTVEQLVMCVEAEHVEILLISTLMFRSALLVRDVVAALPADTRVIVGGAPFRFDDELWKIVGADAMCRSASEVVGAISLFTGVSQ
jgi:methanogenic corrinoid protein MtbC1